MTERLNEESFVGQHDAASDLNTSPEFSALGTEDEDAAWEAWYVLKDAEDGAQCAQIDDGSDDQVDEPAEVQPPSTKDVSADYVGYFIADDIAAPNSWPVDDGDDAWAAWEAQRDAEEGGEVSASQDPFPVDLESFLLPRASWYLDVDEGGWLTSLPVERYRTAVAA